MPLAATCDPLILIGHQCMRTKTEIVACEALYSEAQHAIPKSEEALEFRTMNLREYSLIPLME